MCVHAMTGDLVRLLPYACSAAATLAGEEQVKWFSISSAAAAWLVCVGYA
jgi:hypothetical protein